MTDAAYVLSADHWMKFLVRMPVSLHRQLARIAKQNRRAMTAEAVSRLEWSFREEKHQAVALGVREDQGPHPDLIKLITTLSDAASDEERTLLNHYRQLPHIARAPIQTLLQALANQQP